MDNRDIQPANKYSFSRIIIISISLLVLCGIISALGLFWAPAFGFAVALTAGAWTVLIGMVILLSIALLLFFVIPFFLVFLISVLAILISIAAIVFFPIIFPVVAPILIILLAIGYIRRKV